MDISKYIKNKDIQVSNDDFDIEKLEKDIRKGYVSNEDVENARQEALKQNTANYTALEEKYNKLEKSYNDIEARNTELTNSTKGLKLEVEIVSQGFKKEDIVEVSKLRNSIYSDEQDDTKAISSIKERYGATFGFNKQVEEPKPIQIPNETNFNGNLTPKQEPNITRKTTVKELVIK